MILQISASAPWFVRAAADSALVVHIAGGGIGIASGAAALFAPKGGRLHRQAGNVFFVSMLLMSAIGASVAAMFPSRLSAVSGILTFYLVATAWVTVRRRAGSIGGFEIGALLVALGAAAADLTFGLQATHSAKGALDGFPAGPYFAFAGVAALAALCDVTVIWRRGIMGAQRIARHLWRMCAALFIAASSLFQGQEQLFPKALQGTLLLQLPDFIVLGAMVFWLLRLALSRRYRLINAYSPPFSMPR